MNAYDLLDLLPRAAEAKRCKKPLLVIISCSVDEAKAKTAGELGSWTWGEVGGSVTAF